MNLTSIIPKSWIKAAMVAAVSAAAVWGNRGILSQTGKEYDLGYGAKITITQSIVDKGTNAVEIAKQKAIAAIEASFSK